MTRALIIEAAGNLWGSERSLLDLLTAVPQLRVAVCCPPETPLLNELTRRRIRALPHYVSGLHEKSRWQRARAALGVLRACLTFRPDVIHLNQSGSYKVVLPAARLLRIPIVAHIRIFEDVEYLAQQRPRPGRLAALIAISAAIEDEIGKFPALRAIPVRRIYNAYVPHAPAATHAPDAMADRLACVGRVVPVKGQDLLIAALGLLTPSHPNVRCAIAGEGDPAFVRQLQAAATANRTASHLDWLGFVGDIAPLLRTCSVLVCPSHREPLGRVVLEAWDAGAVPVVFAGSGGAAEIVSAADAGITYDAQTPESLAGAIHRAMDLTPDERANLIERGRRWVRDNCDPVAYGEAFSRLVADAATFRVRPRPRALIVEAAGNLWGSERSLLDLLTAVPALDVAVCCPPDMPLAVELRRRGVRTLPHYVYGLHQKAKPQRLRAALGVLRSCVAFRPNVLHLNQSGSYKIAQLPARLLRIPMVAHIRIFEDVEYLAQQRPNPRRLRGLVAISKAVEDDVRRYPALAKIPLHRIYDAYVSVGSRQAVDHGADRIACVGRLVPVKGQDVLIQALARLRETGLPATCLIVGEGDRDFDARLHKIAAGAGLGESVQWLGFVRDVAPLLRTCRVLVCPSHREPLGRVIFEAWDAGALPIAFAGSGGAAEIIAASEGGILYDRQDPESLGAALRRALALPRDEAARLIDNGRAWMAANCDPAEYGRAMTAILASAGNASR